MFFNHFLIGMLNTEHSNTFKEYLNGFTLVIPLVIKLVILNAFETIFFVYAQNLESDYILLFRHWASFWVVECASPIKRMSGNQRNKLNM